ncbi:acyl-CoA thioesterase [Herbiconiux sp.]|uniref:acyl-CoA thioesterase n=1 Tax=Herbiconiux sp. TaxID=1871186 RepID=UPI0025C025DC|nr:acyl-CoA thioesterase [Herbiconiux sp.]
MSTIRLVHFFFRTLFQRLRSPFRSRVGMWDVATTPFRVLPTDLDVLRHMNNGVYLSLLDIGRLDLMLRSGMWAVLSAQGWYPVVVSETISFRRSLQLWQRFDIETRVLGFDEKAIYVEQRFTVAGEVYSQAFIRARFLKKSGGVVSVAELTELAGVAPDGRSLPSWVSEWGASAQLPPSKASAPSVWE